MACEPNPFSVIGTVTIDRADDAGLIMPRVRTFLAGARAHDSTRSAFDQVLSAPPGQATIVGIGTPAVFYTGDAGTNTNDELKRIWIGNIQEWTAAFKSFSGRSVSELMICGCDVGAGKVGADLMFELAKVMNATIHAPTGFVYLDATCHSLHLEEGAKWKTATPTSRPDDEGTPNPRDGQTPSGDLHLGDVGVIERKAVRDAKPEVDIELSADPRDNRDATFSSSVVALMKAAVASCQSLFTPAIDARLGHVHFDTPYQTSAIPLAVQTGKLTVTFLQGGVEMTREFHVLNNRVLQDAKQKRYYYYSNGPCLRRR